MNNYECLIAPSLRIGWSKAIELGLSSQQVFAGRNALRGRKIDILHVVQPNNLAEEIKADIFMHKQVGTEVIYY